MAAAIGSDADVHIFSARSGFVAPKYQLPSFELRTDPYRDEPNVRFKVLLFKFWRTTMKNSNYPYHTDRITVLYEYEVLPGTGVVRPFRPNGFIKEAMKKANCTLKLVTWSIRDEKVTDVRDVHISPDEEVMRMAVATDRTVTIAFQLRYRRSTYRIRTYLSGRSPLCIGMHGLLLHNTMVSFLYDNHANTKYLS
jgi:hypothetical protein